MKKYLIYILFIIFGIAGCMPKYNKQDIVIPGVGNVKIRTPITQNTPAMVQIKPIPIVSTIITTVTNTDNKVKEVPKEEIIGYIYDIKTSSGTQHDTETSTQEVKSRYSMFKIYHIGAVGLFILGVIMVVIKKPPEIVTGIFLCGSSFVLGSFGGIIPVLSQYAIHILIAAFVLCVIYVLAHRYLDMHKVIKNLPKNLS